MPSNDPLSYVHRFGELLSHDDVRAVKGMAESLSSRPTLTIYTSFDANRPGDTFDAHAVRLRRALAGTAAPARLIAAAERVLLDDGRFRSRALLMNDSAGLLVDFSAPLPVLDDTTGAIASQWGTPMLAPLYYALSAPRYGIVHIDRERARLFETFQGAIQERPVEQHRHEVPSEADALMSSKQVFPSYTPTRGGSAYDDSVTRETVWRNRFFRDVANKVMLWTQKHLIDRLILMGPREDALLLRRMLRPSAADRVAAVLRSLPDATVAPAAVLARVADAIETDRQGILERAASSVGKRRTDGLEACLTATERGQVETLFVPWSMGARAREEILRAAAVGGAHLVFLPDSVHSNVSSDAGPPVPFASLRW